MIQYSHTSGMAGYISCPDQDSNRQILYVHHQILMKLRFNEKIKNKTLFFHIFKSKPFFLITRRFNDSVSQKSVSVFERAFPEDITAECILVSNQNDVPWRTLYLLSTIIH